MREARLRFAPSPTGALHVGGLRTALYNYLLAKRLGGKFILRIEDTDQTRFVPGAEDYIINCLKWANLIPDEGLGFGGDYGPYRQSERTFIYNEYVHKLIDSGNAYYAFDTAQELEEMRSKMATEENKMPKYDFKTRLAMRNSLTLPTEEWNSLIQNSTPYVIRLKVPQDEKVFINDIIRGEVIFNTEDLDDKVLLKSDGLPTYHLANVVDDRLMKISHVVRGEEWLSSTAHHVLLYRYFGWEAEMPQFAHLPLILKPNGQGKLSKRDGAQFGFPVFPLEWINGEERSLGFREFGFLPEAVLNFLALLGWNSGTEKEIFSVEEMQQIFSLDQIGKSGARFDFEKAKWFNAQYIQKADPEQIKIVIRNLFESNQLVINDEELQKVYALYKDRVHFTVDFFKLGKYLVTDQFEIDEEFKNKKWKAEWNVLYLKLIQSMIDLMDWNKENLEEVLKSFMENEKLKMGEVLPSLRVMLSGIPMGPDIYQMLIALGKENVLKRMKKNLNELLIIK
ncbi:MAG: glutamate--tRNA ligase [Saprospiraceae bacterium]